ncbi:MAG TPA: glycosyltransferase family 1 protein [Steroidobacteraceae bacterium]|jgi:glycosyltransferase involved in cell wall biosynthesis|nr:glycosyltransferase family 1 protein [Steroidobacteraceae bacterium]
MKIGIMLRHYDQHGGGVRVYTHQLLRALLDLDSGHEFVFLYRNPSLVGTYAHDARVTEVASGSSHVVLWDQLEVPKLVRRCGIDVLYNPKYSIPLGVACPSCWVCHGLDWYVMPWASRRIDRLSHKYLVPRYARKADAIIAVSEVTRKHVLEYLHVPAGKVHTIYSGVDDAFRQPLDAAAGRSLRERYQLPERFVVYSGAIYPPKNFTRLVQAYAQVGPQRGVSLVIAGGENRFLSEHELRVPEQLGLGNWVRWLGWVEPALLPTLYQLSQGLLLPSLFESFGLPVAEAMAAGCPVLTADCYGTKEVAADAALLVNPESVEDIAGGLSRLIEDESLRARLAIAGRERMKGTTWRRCAEETLMVLENLVAARRATG